MNSARVIAANLLRDSRSGALPMGGATRPYRQLTDAADQAARCAAVALGTPGGLEAAREYAAAYGLLRERATRLIAMRDRAEERAS